MGGERNKYKKSIYTPIQRWFRFGKKMTSRIESERILLSHIEQFTTSSASVLANKRKRRRAALIAELRVAACSLQAKRAAKQLRLLWKDNDGSRAANLSSMGFGSSTLDPTALFYSRLAESREFHKRSIESNGGSGAVAGVDGSFVSEASLTAELGSSGERGIDLRPAWMAATSSIPTVIPQEQQQQQQQKRLEVNKDAVLIASRETSLFGDDEIFGAYVDLSGSGHFEAFCNLPGVKEARFSAAGGKNLADSLSSSGLKEEEKETLSSAKNFAAVSLLDYPGFLRHLSDLHSYLSLPLQPTRFSRQYKRHIASLANYLFNFFQRTHPLIDAPSLCLEWLSAFEADWKAGKVLPHWNAPTSTTSSSSSSSKTINTSLNSSSSASSSSLLRSDLETFSSESDLLLALGAEGCKEQLRLRGLKQGGSPQERASRLFSVKAIPGTDPSKFPIKLRAPVSTPVVASHENNTSTNHQQQEPVRVTETHAAQSTTTLVSAFEPFDVSDMAATRLSALSTETCAVSAWLEYCLARLCIALSDVLKESVRRAERRQTKTLEEIHAERLAERQAEEEEEDEENGTGGTRSVDDRAIKRTFANRFLNTDINKDDDDDDNDDAPVFNPMNIPLGADGKPIPYWLYKIKGLNVTFSCEICGGATYRGHREFDRHFLELKHSAGMKSLGIPNTKAFHGVITIKDAQLLFEKLKKSTIGGGDGVRAATSTTADDLVEEFQDSAGNVVDKKTYADLVRCGLL